MLLGRRHKGLVSTTLHYMCSDSARFRTLNTLSSVDCATLKRKKSFALNDWLKALPGASTTLSFRHDLAIVPASVPLGNRHQRNMPARGTNQGRTPIASSRGRDRKSTRLNSSH